MSLFGESTTTWTVMHGNLFGLTTDTLSFNRDTIINENPWKIINAPGKTIYLQEDLTNGKWLYFTSIDTIQKVLMDLSLAVGDTFYVTGVWLPDPGFYEVDSVYIKDQRKHVQINLPLYYAGDEKLVFIEGVGPNIGLSYKDVNSIELSPYLLCQWKDDIQNYSNNYFDGKCAIFSDNTVNEYHKSETGMFEIYPNPVSNNSVKIEFTDPFAGQIVLVDINGQVILKRLIKDPVLSISLSIPFLTPGIYILNAHRKTGISHSKKIIIR
jgi:hypothetical protein